MGTSPQQRAFSIYSGWAPFSHGNEQRGLLLLHRLGWNLQKAAAAKGERGWK